MAKADLGTKRTCPSCAAKFYDLGRRPARCPKCETEFDPEELKGRVPAAKDLPPEEPEEKAEAAKPAEPDGFEDEADDTPEVDEAAAQMPVSDDEDDDGEGSGLSDDIADDFEEDDSVEEDEDDNTTVLIDEEEDEDFGDFNIEKDEDL